MGEAKRKWSDTNHDRPRFVTLSDDKLERMRQALAVAREVPDGTFEVARVGQTMTGPRRPTWLETTDHKFYRLERELNAWANDIIPLGYARLLTFPCDVEFGTRDDGSRWVEFV